MDPRRLSAGEWVAAAGAVLLLVSLFLPWYRAGSHDLTAWQSMTVDDVLLAVVAAWTLIAVAVTARRSRPVVPVAYTSMATIVGIVGLIVVAWRVADPAPAAHVSRAVGAWLGLVAAAAVAGGSWAGVHDEGPARRNAEAARAAAAAAQERAELLHLPPDAGHAS